MERVSKIFKVLSDKNRIRILLLLTKKDLCVCEIQEILGVTVSTVSKHLSLLKEVGYVSDVREGKWTIYSLNKFSDDLLLSQLLLLLPIYLNDNETIKLDIEKLKKDSKKDKCIQ